MSGLAILVERPSRLMLLVELDDSREATVTGTLGRHVQTVLAQRRRSLTWDQGKEVAGHPRFIVDTGVPVSVCDPKRPWQRGINENTNGLLRQYLLQRTSVPGYPQSDLDAIAAKLNRRPRKTLE